MSPAHLASIDLGRVAATLAERWPDAPSGAELARAAGVAKPTLYARFGSREEVVRASVEHEAERLLDHLYGSDDPGAGLSAYARESPGWRLLLLAGHPAALAARTRIAVRLAHGRGAAPGLRPRMAADAFLAAAGAVLDADSGAPSARALQSLAAALLPLGGAQTEA